MSKTRALAILVFDDAAILDFRGPFEGFSVARRFTDPPAFNVLTVAEKVGSVPRSSPKAELARSVCAALLLAKAGLLDGLEATTHHGAIGLLRQTAPQAAIHADRRFVDNGRVVCLAGGAVGIDMSLHVASRLLGQEVAVKTVRQMECPWSGLS